MQNKTTANWPFPVVKWPFFYGWMVLVCGTLGMLMSLPGQTIGVAAFTEKLLQALGLDRNQLSLAYMAGTISSSLLLPRFGKLYDKVGARKMAFGAAVCLALVLLYLSQIDRAIALVPAGQGIYLTLGFTFVGFLFLRLFGQGLLTMASRNMMMKWFDKRRGMATGFSNVFVALGFSLSPVWFDSLISAHGWRGAWMILALVVGVAFPIWVMLFFRDNPEDTGLLPDGERQKTGDEHRGQPATKRAFTLKQAMRTFPFWVFGLLMAMQALYITGFTFHIVSIFENAGLPKDTAIGVFQPTAFMAVLVTVLGGLLSDRIPLKYLAFVKAFGAMVGLVGLLMLGGSPWGYYLIILGHSLLTGLFSVLTMVTWPRFFGRLHLGAISGQAAMMMVFGSAIGPIMFSLSLSETGGYGAAAIGCLCFYAILAAATWFVKKPQP